MAAVDPWLSETMLPVARSASRAALPVVDLTPSREGLVEEAPRTPPAPEKEAEEPEEKDEEEEEVEGAKDEEESKVEGEGEEVKDVEPKEVEEEPKEVAWVKEEVEPREEGVTDEESVLVLESVPRDKEFWRLMETVENT